MTRARGLALALVVVVGGACQPEPIDLTDDPARYIEDAAWRRAVLETDLTSTDNDYARQRLSLYGVEGLGWDALPERDPPSRALTSADLDRFAAGLPLEGGTLAPLAPPTLPTTEEAWIALGERVFFEYPLRAEPQIETLAKDRAQLREVGFVDDGEGGFVAVRVFQDAFGELRLGHSCAQCHASVDPNTGAITAVRSNRAMNLGAIRLLADGLEPGELPPELDTTAYHDLDRLGPGRGDVLDDGEFNPYAFPDLGGLVDMPFLHHNANWRHRAHGTLAVRCETLFITAAHQTGRVPRVLSWALAAFYRSLPAPASLISDEPADPALLARGEELFASEGCIGCHTPPLYTSATEVDVEVIGTEPSAGLSPARFSGHYRVPSLRGVGGNAPYLHHGAFWTLEEMFTPGRDSDEPGHPFGLGLEDPDREALLAFLRSI